MKWPLLLSVVLVLSACDRKPPPSSRSPSTPLAEEQSPNVDGAAHQDVAIPASSSAANHRDRDSIDSSRSPLPLERASSDAGVPPHGSPLPPEEAHRLLSGAIVFNPGAIPSSGVAVEPDTPLDPGQDVQVKWGSSWWAGTILGLEQDGRVKIHYFGWADSWDEAKPRTELQLDRGARVRALESTYVRKDW